MKVLLHIGTMKTGSTSIQDFLSLNFKTLLSAGIYCAPYPCRTTEAISASLLAAQNENADHVIISDEGLWHFSFSSFSPTKALADLLKNHEVELVVYFREPQSYLESCYLQGLKSGSTAVTFSEYERDYIIRRSLGYSNMLSRYCEAFPGSRAHVRVYDRELLHGKDIITDFSNIMKPWTGGRIDLNMMHRPESTNPTPDWRFLMFGLVARQIPHLRQDGLREWLRTQVYAETDKFPEPFLSKQEKVRIVQRTRPFCEAIASSYHPDGPANLFPNWPEKVLDGPETSIPDLRIVAEQFLKLISAASEKSETTLPA